jgi:hypothetical protein
MGDDHKSDWGAYPRRGSTSTAGESFRPSRCCSFPPLSLDPAVILWRGLFCLKWGAIAMADSSLPGGGSREGSSTPAISIPAGSRSNGISFWSISFIRPGRRRSVFVASTPACWAAPFGFPKSAMCDLRPAAISMPRRRIKMIDKDDRCLNARPLLHAACELASHAHAPFLGMRGLTPLSSMNSVPATSGRHIRMVRDPCRPARMRRRP